MKVMRLKIMLITYGVGFLLFFGLLVFVALFISNEDDSSGENDLTWMAVEVFLSQQMY